MASAFVFSFSGVGSSRPRKLMIDGHLRAAVASVSLALDGVLAHKSIDGDDGL